MDITNYLKKNVNKTENIKDLIYLYLNRINFSFGTIFLYKNNKVYSLINNVIKNENSNYSISYIPEINTSTHFISNEPESTNGYNINNYLITNIIIIPIIIENNIIGVVCLGNKDTEIYEEDVNLLLDLICITQLVLNNIKLIDDYKKVYADSTYFSKDLFLANMSHEIRTPLNGIIGYNQLLMTTDLTFTQQSYLSSVNHCSLQLMQIINDVIDFSKLSSGNMKISKDYFSLEELLSSINETMKQKILSKKQTFSYYIEKNTPSFIVTDKQKLIQIIINLISNSINFTPINGHIYIIISNINNSITVSVTDNGIGISEINQCKLFNSFTQINNKMINTGTGLGLAICKKLVELLNGTITVYSKINYGSTFTFTFIHHKLEDMELKLKKDIKLLSGKYILTVDANLDSRIFLSDLLFEWDMLPIICSTTREALKLINDNRYKFELALIDMSTPEINGEELAKIIKETKPMFPIIALSSVNNFINISYFNSKLNKPLNKIQLFDVIYSIIKQNKNDSSFIGNTIKENSLINAPITQFHKNFKILIAEDIIYNQILIQTMIQNLGYNNITLASNGEETINLLNISYTNKDPYIIILLDLRMPVIDGYEVIEYIKKKGFPLPIIIAVTASVLEEDKEKCKLLGVQYFINKPINMQILRDVILKITHYII